MGIKFNNPFQVEVNVPANVDALDVKITRFMIDREQIPEHPTQLSVSITLVFGVKETNGSFTALKEEVFVATNAQARAFLRSQVSGRLGAEIEKSILASLVSLGKLKPGKVEAEE